MAERRGRRRAAARRVPVVAVRVAGAIEGVRAVILVHAPGAGLVHRDRDGAALVASVTAGTLVIAVRAGFQRPAEVVLPVQEGVAGEIVILVRIRAFVPPLAQQRVDFVLVVREGFVPEGTGRLGLDASITVAEFFEDGRLVLGEAVDVAVQRQAGVGLAPGFATLKACAQSQSPDSALRVASTSET